MSGDIDLAIGRAVEVVGASAAVRPDVMVIGGVTYTKDAEGYRYDADEEAAHEANIARFRSFLKPREG